MKRIVSFYTLLICLGINISFCGKPDDWAQFGIYGSRNDSIKSLNGAYTPKVVFMGNSITEGWMKEDPSFFKDNGFLCRGISGQTSYQMLLRFRKDVIELQPEMVVINAGTNDIAENNHPYNEDTTFGNIVSMVELSQANGIKPVLSSVLPTDRFYWNETVMGIPQKIKSLNCRLREYARCNNLPFADYYAVMQSDSVAMNPEYSLDGVHPNVDGYKVMEPVVLKLINESMQPSQPIEISLWQDSKPRFESGLSSEEEIEVNSGWITHVTKPVLYVFPAAKPNGKALLMCPGGGYEGVAIAHEGKELAPILNEEGIALAVLKYRMPNGNCNVPLEDVARAMDILKLHSQEWGIDVDKIGIGGASAGGHLASTYAVNSPEGSLKAAFQVLLYPVISMRSNITHEGSRSNLLGSLPSDSLINTYSNEMQVSESTPPAFIVVSADDDIVPVENSTLYFSALNSKGIPAALFVYPSGGHGWGTSKDFKFSKEWIEELKAWLNGF